MSKFTRREFLEDSLLAATAASAVPFIGTSARAQLERRVSPNDVIRVGVIGVNGRGRAHVGAFKKSKDSEVAAICDCDEGVIGIAMKAVPKAKYYKDIRKLLEDDSIDAVSIATPNHWHSLAAIWAIQAGKHVYVEKPISHNVFEGKKVVEAARKHGRIVQHGTQARSMQATIEAMEWLQKGGLGKVKIARGLCYKPRVSIGKVDGPQKPPKTMDYDLWTGPAEMQPLMRKDVHYDWHWVFNTGNGDIGNQGVHQMDIARWGLGVSELPKSVMSLGGRLGYDDDGDTPNTLVSVYDYGDRQLIFEVRGLRTSSYKKAKIGVVFHCEDGYLVSANYGRLQAFDHEGKVVKTFEGGGDHFQNFLDAIKSGKHEDLTAESLEGHRSAALCHLGNISYMVGKEQTLSATDTPFGEHEAANESFRRFRTHLTDNGLDAGKTSYVMGPSLEIDAETEAFVGQNAPLANRRLTRKYRGEFIVRSEV